jgi:hypothetical protein
MFSEPEAKMPLAFKFFFDKLVSTMKPSVLITQSEQQEHPTPLRRIVVFVCGFGFASTILANAKFLMKKLFVVIIVVVVLHLNISNDLPNLTEFLFYFLCKISLLV